MKKSSLVSIIMPAYNAQKYIKETIKSVLNQTYKNWELIIINDGSVDNTTKIIKSFKDKRIILIEQENKGVSAARNRGLEVARGEYITFLDADDILPPKSIEVRVKYLEVNPEVDLVDGIILVKDFKTQKIIRKYQPYYQGKLLKRLLRLDDRVFFNVCYFFRKKILNNTYFNTSMNHVEDLLFYIEISSKQSIKYSFINEEIYYYRYENSSAMSDLSGIEIGYLQFIQEIKKLPNISFIDFLILKIKICKIMFLSWLRRREYKKAIISGFKIIVS